MLVVGRDHKLYYEAYNDASDLNGDGKLDVGYKGYLKTRATNPTARDRLLRLFRFVQVLHVRRATFHAVRVDGDKTCGGAASGAATI